MCFFTFCILIWFGDEQHIEQSSNYTLCKSQWQFHDLLLLMCDYAKKKCFWYVNYYMCGARGLRRVTRKRVKCGASAISNCWALAWLGGWVADACCLLVQNRQARAIAIYIYTSIRWGEGLDCGNMSVYIAHRLWWRPSRVLAGAIGVCGS